jgi:hypothetical protein
MVEQPLPSRLSAGHVFSARTEVGEILNKKVKIKKDGALNNFRNGARIFIRYLQFIY